LHRDNVGRDRSCSRTTYLGERHGVQSILRGDLESDIVAALGVPRSLCAGLYLHVDLVIVGRGEDAQVVGRGNRRRVFGQGVPDCRRISRNGRLLHIVTSFGTDQEALVTQDCVKLCGGTIEQVKECTGVEVRLLEMQVELCTLLLGVRQELCEKLGLQSLGDGVIKLDLGVERVGSRPRLGKGQACSSVEHQQLGPAIAEDDLKINPLRKSGARSVDDVVEMIEIYTHRRIAVLGLNLYWRYVQHSNPLYVREHLGPAHITSSVTLMVGFAFDGETDAIGGL